MSELNTAEALEAGIEERQVNADDSSDVAAKKADDDPEQQATAKKTDDEPDGEDEPKRLSGWQRKKLQTTRLQAEVEFWRDEALKRREADKPEKKEATTSKRPKLEEYQTVDAYEDAVLEYTVSKASEKVRESVLKEVEQKSEQKKVQSDFATQVVAARKLHSDYDEVSFSHDTPVTDAMREALLTSEQGALIAYELGKNPEEAARISKLAPVAQIREIGKIEAHIANRNSAPVEDKAPTVAQSRAPKPPTPVQKASAADTGLRDDLPYKEWVKRREAQLQGK